MIRYFIFAVVLVPLVAGCGRPGPVSNFSKVDKDDPKMNAAIEKARSTVNDFIAALNSPKPGQSAFSVKMPFTDGANTEHFWLSPVSYDGAIFHGTVNNDPEMVTNVRIGQQATVEPAKISDWMYVADGKLVGGQTLRVLRDSLTAGERQDFDKSVPFVIE